jgi:hypothetical protein
VARLILDDFHREMNCHDGNVAAVDATAQFAAMAPASM